MKQMTEGMELCETLRARAEFNIVVYLPLSVRVVRIYPERQHQYTKLPPDYSDLTS